MQRVRSFIYTKCYEYMISSIRATLRLCEEEKRVFPNAYALLITVQSFRKVFASLVQHCGMQKSSGRMSETLTYNPIPYFNERGKKGKLRKKISSPLSLNLGQVMLSNFFNSYHKRKKNYSLNFFVLLFYKSEEKNYPKKNPSSISKKFFE